MGTLLYLLHERLPVDTLLLHLRLLTHLNNHNHKPAIISYTLTLPSPLSQKKTNTQTHFFKSKGVTWQPLQCNAGHAAMQHGKGYLQSAKGQILYFKRLSARLNSGSTNNYFPGPPAPCRVILVQLAIQESNYCKHKTENIGFSSHLDTAWCTDKDQSGKALMHKIEINGRGKMGQYI